MELLATWCTDIKQLWTEKKSVVKTETSKHQKNSSQGLTLGLVAEEEFRSIKKILSREEIGVVGRQANKTISEDTRHCDCEGH